MTKVRTFVIKREILVFPCIFLQSLIFIFLFFNFQFLACASYIPGDSLEYAQFIKNLQPIFTDEKIRSILSNLPSKCKIYGYDIGDISGDGSIDIVLSARSDENIRKELGIYFFLNTEAKFELVQILTRKYVNEPIEIGFSIESPICFITQKLGEYRWEIVGYTLSERIFKKVSIWTTRRLPTRSGFSNIGLESYDDFQSLRSTEMYYRASDNKPILKNEFYSLPIFPAYLKIPPDVQRIIGDSTYKIIREGASNWFGSEDCSLFSEGIYDDEYMTITVKVKDDFIVSKDTSDEADHVQLWFDLSGKEKIDGMGNLSRASSNDIVEVKIYMGDGFMIPTRMEIIPISLNSKQAGHLKKIQHAFYRIDYGAFLVLCKLPMQLFHVDENIPSVGFSAVYYDIDNPGHPERRTIIATSDNFESGSPDTFGKLYFHPKDRIILEREDTRVREIIRLMSEAALLY